MHRATGLLKGRARNQTLWDLGFKRDTIRFALPEAPSGYWLGVRGTVERGGLLGGWGPDGPSPR